MRRYGGRTARTMRRLARAAVLAATLGAAGAACTVGARDRSHDPAYLCPKLLDRCHECRRRQPGFSEFNCAGSDREILERCRGRAGAREAWLDTLSAALAQESCREFADVL